MKLLALNCPDCGQRLTPENEAIVTRCDNCLTAVHLHEDGLTTLPVRYIAPPASKPIGGWYPIWVYEGMVKITRRHTQGGRRGRNLEAANEYWANIRQFFVPGWQLHWRQAQSISIRLIQSQPQYITYDENITQPFATTITDATDSRKLLELIILAVEARADDWLKDLKFDLALGNPVLWALPGVGGKLLV